MTKYPIRHDKSENNSPMLGDGKFALGCTLGAIGVIFVYLIFEYRSNSATQPEYIKFAPIVISLLVAMTSTYMAANALLEQRKTREAGTDPILIVHLGQREDARELITFCVSNVGAGAALNVSLSVDDVVDNVAERNFVTNIFRRHHPFAAILQGKSIEFSLGVGWELLGDHPLPPFQAQLSYEDLAGGEYESEFTIDVREMEGLGAHVAPQVRIANALEKIAQK